MFFDYRHNLIEKKIDFDYSIIVLQRTILEWRLVFWIMMVVMSLSSVVFVVFGTGEVQPWDDLEQHHLREKEKERRGLPIDEQITIKQARVIEEGEWPIRTTLPSLIYIPQPL